MPFLPPRPPRRLFLYRRIVSTASNSGALSAEASRRKQTIRLSISVESAALVAHPEALQWTHGKSVLNEIDMCLQHIFPRQGFLLRFPIASPDLDMVQFVTLDCLQQIPTVCRVISSCLQMLFF